MPAPEPVQAARCVLDTDRPRAATVGLLCRSHLERLGDMLDPNQHGQMFAKPGEHRTPGSIAVLYDSLDPQPARRAMDSQVIGGAFCSTPPGRLDVMSLRDRRSDPGDDANLWSTLGTLVGIAMRLDIRDIHGRPEPIPSAVGAVCVWLLARLDTLAEADWVADAWHDLRAVHRQLRTAAGDPLPRPLGPCWKRVDDDGNLDDAGQWECGHPLYLPPQPLKGMDEPVVLPDDLRCTGCGGHYDRGEIVRVGRARKVSA